MPEQFSGQVTVVDSQGRQVFAFDPQAAVLDLGAQGNEGDLRLRGNDGESKIHLDGGGQELLVTNAAGWLCSGSRPPTPCSTWGRAGASRAPRPTCASGERTGR